MLTDEEMRALRIGVELECVRNRLTRWNLWLRGLPGCAPELIGADRCMSIESRYMRHTHHGSGRLLLIPAEEGLEIERLMRALPEKNVLAIKYAYVRIHAPLDQKCRAVGVGKSQFYRLLHDGEFMVRNHLHYRESFVRATLLLLQVTVEQITAMRKSLTTREKGEQNAASFG